MSEETPKPARSKEIAPPPSHGGTASGKNQGWLIAGVLVAVGLLGLILFRVVLRRPPPPPVPPPVMVSSTNAVQGDMGIYVDGLLGVVTPIATVSVPSQVSGQLIKVNYTEGQMVRAGDVLAEIDPRQFQATLDSAEGQLERDQALLAEAQTDLKRYQAAYAQKAIPKQLLDDQTGLVEQDAGSVKYDQGQVESAKVQLGYCHITSPISGRVGLRLIDPGNIVLASSTNGLVMITELEPITVVFSVAEDFLPQIQHQLTLGNHMSVQSFDRSEETLLATGSVLALDNLIDTVTGSVRIKAIFTNKNDILFPNQFVNVKLLIDTLHRQTLIPASVVQRNGTATFVYLLTPEETVKMQSITISATDGDKVAVSGLKPGEAIVADNFNRLQDGAKVRVRKGEETRKKTKG
jgi:membrane fusion protein, multidrug efflux system